MGVSNLLRVASVMGLIASGGAVSAEQLSGTTPSTGSGGYTTMISLANLVGKYTDHSVELNTNVPAPTNMVGLGRGKDDLGYIAFSLGEQLSAGTGSFKELENNEEVWGNIRVLFSFPAGYFHVLTYADSGIEGFADLKGKSVYAGPANGSQEALMKLLTASVGLEAGTDFEMARLDYAGGEQAFKDGLVSVMIKPAPLGAASVEQFGLSRPIRFLGVPDEALDVEGVKTFFGRAGRMMSEIPPNTYAGQQNEEGAKSLAFALGVGVNKNVQEDVVYDIMSTILTHFGEFKQSAGAMFNTYETSQMFDQVNAPLHAGAVRAFRDAGIDVPEALVPPEMN